MLDETKRQTIVKSFKLVVPIAETAADLFYRRLFELRPEFRALFPPDMEKQKQKLVKMLAFIVKSLDYRDRQWTESVEESQDLMFVVLALGRRHAELYRIPTDSYAPVGEALLWALDYGLGQAFTDDIKAAWGEAYQALATTMKLGMSAQVDPRLGLVSA